MAFSYTSRCRWSGMSIMITSASRATSSTAPTRRPDASAEAHEREPG